MDVKIKLLNEQAALPAYSREGDAAVDLTATSISTEGSLVTYGTGVSVEIPEGHVGLLFPRSSLSKYDLILANHVGVIDSNYRGEIILKFRTGGGKLYVIGDRIGQLMIIPIPKINFIQVNELSDTNRGDQGFGSSGS